MRGKSILLLAATLLSACSQDTTGPAVPELDALASFSVSGGFAYGVSGMPGRGMPELRRLSQLPDSIKLTPVQETEINALLEGFQAANQADLDALAAIHERAHAARVAGQSHDAVMAILLEGSTIRTRLATALTALRTAIDAVLSDAQRAWLATNRYRGCDPTTAPVLSAEQKTKIEALITAFRTTNAADLAAVQGAHQEVRAARQAGKTQAEIDAILAGVAQAMARLQAAGAQLRTDIDALLTPEQRASACLGRMLGHGAGYGVSGMGGMGQGGMGGMGKGKGSGGMGMGGMGGTGGMGGMGGGPHGW